MISQCTYPQHNGKPQQAIVGRIMHIVNKTLPGYTLKHVFAFVWKVRIVLRYCLSHPLVTKTVTLQTQ